ncbi:copper amine oxidase N-terminal domain-containing protein [Paenibacillus zeisoli]|uniref:Copper amine oxidase N-terminal domain-containing protein n=1 Tax=Paenibacillus zeisoli TaxID=2496267 RepID=A0A433XNK0_9BACL|nr:copper amine oxidase N-terminal domain-containing protein [Paenibacillus zeisoli]RUT35649.1 copper amine oxidase N-terminal domain-containing protein [Paenibacillus zeisoli]
MKSNVMKYIVLTFLVFGLALTPLLNLNTAAAASAPANKAIRVYVHNKEIHPSSAPIIRYGRVFVELRSILKTLGYTLSYDDKKKVFSAVSEDKTIKIDLKTGKANLSGEAFPNDPKDPYVITGAASTFVDLEFLDYATGLETDWDKANRTIKVHKSTTGEPLKADIREMNTVIKKMFKAIKDGDTKGYLSLINKDSDYEFYEEVMSDPTLLTKYAGYTSIDKLTPDFDHTPADGNYMVKRINADIYIPKRPGELLDRIEHLSIDMELDKNYKWTIDYLGTEDTEYVNYKEVLKKEAEVPETDKTAIRALLDAFIKALNDRNVEAVIGTMNTDSSNIKEVKNGLFRIFALSDLEIKTECMSIVSYDNNSATIYLIQKNRYTDYGLETRNYTLHKLIKLSDGTWRIALNGSVQLEEEVLHDHSQ